METTPEIICNVDRQKLWEAGGERACNYASMKAIESRLYLILIYQRKDG